MNIFSVVLYVLCVLEILVVAALSGTYPTNISIGNWIGMISFSLMLGIAGLLLQIATKYSKRNTVKWPLIIIATILICMHIGVIIF